MKRKALCVILTLALALGLAVPAFAVSYSDLNGHWAKAYMEDLSNRGFLNGYDDGTMKPDASITAAEVLALLSRLYTPSEDAVNWINADYEGFLTSKIDPAYTWAYDEFAICLAAGIITENELSALKLSGAVTKELLAVYTVRAMGMEDTALGLTIVKLGFADASSISDSCKRYVSVLSGTGIITGDEDNNFSPQSLITRAVAATIISRVLSYNQANSVSLKIDAYEGLEKAEGFVYSATSETLRLRTFDGFIREFSVPADATVKVGSAAKPLSALISGSYAQVTLKDGTVTGVHIPDDGATWLLGTISSLYNYAGVSNIFFTPLGSTESTKYIVPGTAEITMNGKTAGYSNLVTGGFAAMKLEKGTVSRLAAYSTTTQITGNISALSYGTTITLKLTDANGGVWYFPIEFSALPAITRGDTAITIDRLYLGDKISVTAFGGTVTAMKVESPENTITGELISSTATATGTTWTIKDASGQNWTLAVDKAAGVYSGSTALLLSDIAIGDTVTVTVYGNTITEIVRTAGSSSTKIIGTVLSVDSTGKTITLLVSGKLVYITVTPTNYILQASSGKIIRATAIAPESPLVAYGTYDSGTAFTAKIVIIEN